jgi:hypothetical protein
MMGPLEWPRQDVASPLGVTAWTAETGFLVSDEDVEAVHQEITVVLPCVGPDDRPRIAGIIGPAPLLAVIRLDRHIVDIAVELDELRTKLDEFMAGGTEIARLVGRSEARGRVLGEVGDLCAAIADVLAFAMQRLGHAGNGRTNGDDH